MTVGSIIWMVIFLLIFGVQLLQEGRLAFTIAKLNILPARFLTLFFVVLGVALLVSFLLLFVKQSKKFLWRFLRSVMALLIAVIMSLGGIVGVDLAHTLTGSLKELSAATHPGSVVGVYVRIDDPAQSFEDARDYIFTYGEDFDPGDSRKAIYEIQNILGTSIETREELTVLDAIDSLYAGTTGALIMNEVYEDILISTEGDEEGNDYSDFLTKARRLGEIELQESEIAVMENEEPAPQETRVVDVTREPFIVYLSGSDTRAKMLTTSRSDVNILAVVNPLQHQVLLVNTPRDYYVPISRSPEGAKDKLTHCGIYGISCSIDTLDALYNMKIDYFAQINFTGFEKLIDAVGGVDVYSDVAVKAEGGWINIKKGDNHLNGKDALVYARERHLFAGGDNDRGKNQMKIIRSLIDKFTSPAILQNYSEILASLEGMMITDFGADNFTRMVKLQLDNGGGWEVLSYAANGTGKSDYTYSMPRTKLYVMEPAPGSVAKATAAIQKVMDGQRITQEDLN